MASNPPSPLAWAKAATAELAQVKGVCLDIDDTLSTHGKLTPEAFDALWSLKRAGFAIVPITGRPAGWCDHIARFWPVDAVVGENGAFTFYMHQGVRKRLDTPMGAGLTPESARTKLKSLESAIRARFAHARWASDQSYREYDLAIDICEDVPTWPKPEVEQLLKLCHDQGAHAKLSSIHVNAWFGDYDKKRGFQHALESGILPGPKKLSQWIYIGDSPNDEPMFELFPKSVGVANLKQYLGRLQHPPTWLTKSESGDGFAEMAARLLKARPVKKKR